MKKVGSLIMLSIVILSGCYYDNEEELYPNQTSTTTPTTVTYSSDIQPLIASNCASSNCHQSGATSPDLSDYTKLTANITRVKVRAIDEKTMPSAGPLSNADIAKLQSWIDARTPYK
jgi:PBP1b-binding outer membrane lipoprotein LpoB